MPADEAANAHKAWVTKEIVDVGERSFELGKFFFGISVGSYAALPFLKDIGGELRLDSPLGYVPLIMFGISTAIAIAMVIPVTFKLNHETNIIGKHRSYVRKQRFLIAFWSLTWITGVAGLLFLLFLPKAP